jgi:LysM repeat protein
MRLNSVFFVFLFFICPSLAFSTKLDSIGIEKSGEKYFLLHRVEKFEDIYSIAKKYGITAKEISGYNTSVDVERLREGMILKIIYKKHVPQMKAYRVKNGETLHGIARKFGVDVENINKLNGFYHSKIRSGQQLLIGFDKQHPDLYAVPFDFNKQWELSYHTVQQGETLFRIAKDFNTKTDSIALWNGIENNQIKVGQILLVGRKLAGAHNYAQNNTERSSDGSDIAEERGAGEIMYTGSQQLYALHRTAPVGSFLVVHNESLNRSVRVKVIGEIPKNDANKKYIVKLSEAACEELGFNNREFYVRVVFRKMK